MFGSPFVGRKTINFCRDQLSTQLFQLVVAEVWEHPMMIFRVSYDACRYLNISRFWTHKTTNYVFSTVFDTPFRIHKLSHGTRYGAYRRPPDTICLLGLTSSRLDTPGKNVSFPPRHAARKTISSLLELFSMRAREENYHFCISTPRSGIPRDTVVGVSEASDSGHCDRVGPV